MRDLDATVIVDLTRPEEQILAELDKQARWGINRAVKEGLIVFIRKIEPNKDHPEFREFYNIYKQTVELGGDISYPLENIRDRADYLLFCHHPEHRTIAGATIRAIPGQDTAILQNLASLHEFNSHQPNNLLLWECILLCKQLGFKKFDLGGYQINPRGHLVGINKFKEKWGEIVHIELELPWYKVLARKAIRKWDWAWRLSRKLK